MVKLSSPIIIVTYICLQNNILKEQQQKRHIVTCFIWFYFLFNYFWNVPTIGTEITWISTIRDSNTTFAYKETQGISLNRKKKTVCSSDGIVFLCSSDYIELQSSDGYILFNKHKNAFKQHKNIKYTNQCLKSPHFLCSCKFLFYFSLLFIFIPFWLLFY